jgi:ABC-type lipoprotein release transport system permease subunit
MSADQPVEHAASLEDLRAIVLAPAGAAFGLVVARVAGSYFSDLKIPGALAVIVSAFVLLGAAVVASMLPAARAARVDVIQALRSE